MEDLVRWLNTQLDTDAARAGQWHDLECEIHTHLDAGLIAAVAASRMLAEVPGAVCDCGGPARVLRDIDAKREIVARYVKAVQAVEELKAARERLSTQGQDALMTELDLTSAIHQRDTLHRVVFILATVYADRPGYEEGWAP